MDIRTKLVFAQVSVALLSMLALGLAMFGGVQVALYDGTRDQLDALADLKAESVQQVVDSWHDRISLVASRTQLRQSLDGFVRTGSPVEIERVGRILDDAVSGSSLFGALSVRDMGGNTLVEVISPEGLAEAQGSVPVPGDGEITRTGLSTRYERVTFRSAAAPTVTFSSPLVLDGSAIGSVHGVIVADELIQLTRNPKGLGRTGETMVVVRDSDGAVRTLHPVRAALPVNPRMSEPDSGASGDTGDEGEVNPARSGVAGVTLPSDGPGGRALIDNDGNLLEGLIDYRGQAVVAATRFVPEMDWGIVVKVDEAERRQPIETLRSDSIRVAVIFAAFAILFGTVLGYGFAQPIHTLAEVAGRFGAGQLTVRSGMNREDEVGLLARTFDEMAEVLEDQVELLSEFRRFFEVSIDMMCIASTDGYLKKVNPAFVRELGWPEEELLRRPFIQLVHPEDVAATQAEVEKLAGGTPTIRFANRFLCMDGSYKMLHWNAFPEEETGRLYSIARVQSPEGVVTL